LLLRIMLITARGAGVLASTFNTSILACSAQSNVVSRHLSYYCVPTQAVLIAVTLLAAVMCFSLQAASALSVAQHAE
jgi:hypothetical protein